MKSKSVFCLAGVALLLIASGATYTQGIGRPLAQLKRSRNAFEREEALLAYFEKWQRASPTWIKARNAMFDLIGGEKTVGVPGPAQPAVLDELLTAQQFNEAADFVRNLPSSGQRSRLIKQLARQWMQTDEPGALRWLGSAPDQIVRSNALAAIFEMLSEDNPTFATKCALSLTDPDYRGIALRVVLQTMVRAGDDQPIVTWLKSGARVREFDGARSLAIPHLAQTDPVGATALLDDMVDTRMKNSASRELAFVISRSSRIPVTEPQEKPDPAVATPEK